MKNNTKKRRQSQSGKSRKLAYVLDAGGHEILAIFTTRFMGSPLEHLLLRSLNVPLDPIGPNDKGQHGEAVTRQEIRAAGGREALAGKLLRLVKRKDFDPASRPQLAVFDEPERRE